MNCTNTLLRACAAVLLLAALGIASANAQSEAPQQIFFDAFELLRTGQFAQAEAKFREGLALEPQNASARLFLGDALRGKKDLAGARAAYEEAARSMQADVAQQARERIAQLGPAAAP